ncbi:hypothetical protein VUR80DRAFT_9451 [Thermomyces stellatus]
MCCNADAGMWKPNSTPSIALIIGSILYPLSAVRFPQPTHLFARPDIYGMDSRLAILKSLLLKTPLLLKTALLHTLSLTPTSQKWSLRTELTVAVLRAFIGDAPPETITSQQARFLKDPGVKGSMWVSKVTLPPPEDAVRELLFTTIEGLKSGGEEYAKPSLQPVEGEWVGPRRGVEANAPEPKDMSEMEKYERLVAESGSDLTLLYFHGGSYYLMDPAWNRPLMAKYADLSGGRVFSLRYRLAPQNPFPAALLDSLTAYLSLLYPPPGALHDPVPPSRILLCGDSAGGNLATVLLQTLLHLHRTTPAGETPTVTFHGAEVSLPLPAGVALNSPSVDLTRCLQGSGPHKYDYLPPNSRSPALSPPCAIWPADPPRAELLCEGSALCHSLVSPISAPSWAGSPPIFVVCGEEKLTDEGKLFAQKAARDGATVVWEQYEAMPHCFALVLEGTAEAASYFQGWTRFVERISEGEPVETTGEFIEAKTVARRPVNVRNLLSMSDEDVKEAMRGGQRAIEERFAQQMASSQVASGV